MKTEASRQWWQVLLCAGLVVLVSQVSVALLDDGFHISVAVVLFQVLLFLSPELPVLPVTLLAASGVFLLRLAVQLLLGGTLAGCWKAHAPEMLFYLCYGLLFHALFRRKRKQSYRFAFCLPLAAIDALSNLMELLVRMGLRTFSPTLLLQITAVGLVRALLAGIILPREQLPGVLEAIGDWLPLSHAIDALSDVAAETVDSATASSMLVIVAWIAAALLVGSLTLRRRTA